ncbi:MAG: carbamoyl-phosphate synthase large subunit [Alphaproteobacteria bacterium]|jgi:acetyl/propionyl-CoA carboxylase alpha subunit|nr:carbamoyl-phosphate synthase large subunit [Alphaproteobacteria bacterium]
MGVGRILIANRGEVAIRIARAAAELGVGAVMVHAEDDARSLHVQAGDDALPLAGQGAAAYLDIAQIVAAAQAAGCDAVHPGYGFLSENAAFAAACAAAGLTFIGPSPEALALFGDKARARALAGRLDVPLLPGTSGPTDLAATLAFFDSLGDGAAVMIKAIAGGGGRGMRPVLSRDALKEAWTRCRSEARAAFGQDGVYVERLIARARHIEIQVVGDGEDVVAVGDRDCTLQRRRQKLVEIAPAPGLDPAIRDQLARAAARMARAAGYRGLGTFEFLLDQDGHWFFMEANPRLQVEHTVTEEVTGIDLVATQIEIAGGGRLADLGLADRLPQPSGFAIQLRINMETMTADGDAQPSGGVLHAYDLPSGPGIRVDGFGYAGYATSSNYDSLLAKLIVSTRGRSYADTIAKAYRALGECRITGVATNIGFLQTLLRRPEVVANAVDTRFIETHAADLVADGQVHDIRYFADDGAAAAVSAAIEGPPGSIAAPAPMQGRLVAVAVSVGDAVASGAQLAVIEAMKMEHLVTAETAGHVRAVVAAAGDQVGPGQPLLFIEPAAIDDAAAEADDDQDPDAIRPDLAEVIERHAVGLDARRPEAVARRRKTGQRTARENIDDLCDPGSFVEYGALAIAAQRQRRPLDDLIRNTPADGLVAGIGTVNAALFDEARARCMVLAYDYTVLAGTQGFMNHKKTDRMLGLAEQWRLPLVLFAEGGGGRPGDTDVAVVAGLDVPSFQGFARLSAGAPLVGIVSGRCFAGNAALLGCCDVIIATQDATIGMSGPAMIEGGGLGVFRPEEVGPIAVQTKNGVVDLAVADEGEAVAAARRYLAYFQGRTAGWTVADQRLLRRLIPENRLRVYDVRQVITTIADEGSVMELRRDFGIGIVTALIRVEGHAFGLMANNPHHLGGAIDADAADKAARFMQLCDAFGLPIVSLCDTPGFMVGPDIEKRAQVRHVSRMFVTAANIGVPIFTLVLRKGYGLGAQAMTGGSFHAPFFIASWPSGEFGGMGLEGAVRLGYRKELDAMPEGPAREALYRRLVDEMYVKGKAINMASFLEIDAVIDPVETRRWILRGLASIPPASPGGAKRRPFIDTW